MKTSIVFDDDVALFLKKRMSEGQTMRQVVNELLRGALGLMPPYPPLDDYPTFDSGGYKPGVDGTKFNDLFEGWDKRDAHNARSGEDAA